MQSLASCRKTTAMNMAQAAGLFLSLYKEINGSGAEVAFPGDPNAWEALHTDTSQDILAKFHIFASLHPEETKERAFNVVDGPATAWKEVWPEICEYFGLKGVPPAGSGEPFKAVKWMQERRSAWSGFVEKYAIEEGRSGSHELRVHECCHGHPDPQRLRCKC